MQFSFSSLRVSIHLGPSRGANYSFVLNRELLDASSEIVPCASEHEVAHVLVIVLRLSLNITGTPSAVEDEVKSRCERRRGGGRFITSKGRLASPRRKTKPAITVIPSAR